MFLYILATTPVLGVVLDVMENVVQYVQDMQLSSAWSNCGCVGWEEIDVLGETS